MKGLRVVLFVLWWCCLVGCTPEGVGVPDAPSSTTTSIPAPASTTTAPPEPPVSQKPQDYIQWSCHESKPTCRDRFDWVGQVDFAYTVWRGSWDLRSLLTRGRRYLKGGTDELVDMTPGELRTVIEKMELVNARGDRLIRRITTEKHRDFDEDPLAAWHRSQVRKDVARGMVNELVEQTDVYTLIAGAFPLVKGCDSLRCWLKAQE